MSARKDADLWAEYNGTTQGEVLLFQALGPTSILLRNIAVPWIFVGFRFAFTNGFWLKLLLDFVLIVFPVIMALTFCADYIPLLLMIQTVALFSLILFMLCEYLLIAREKPSLRSILNHVIDEQHSPTKFITYMRSMGLVATSIAILAVDFDVFPRRFAKTYAYGRSIMDLGTATFIYCFAVVDVFKDFRCRRSIFGHRQRRFFLFRYPSVLFLLLGAGRAVLLTILNYHQEVTEYGIHWNFFLTLACLKAITKMLGRRFHFLFGILFASIYQYLLTEGGLQDWLLSKTTPRDDLISMNREGIFSLFGYLTLYYFASVIATFLSHTGIRLKSWLHRSLQLLVITGLLFIFQKVSEIACGPPSRRVANLPYVFEMLVFHTIYMDGFLFIQLVSIFGWTARMPQFSVDESPFDRLKPCLLESISQQGMLFFLFTNVLTGSINMSIRTTDVTNNYHSTGVITAYMFVACSLVHFISKKQSH